MYAGMYCNGRDIELLRCYQDYDRRECVRLVEMLMPARIATALHVASLGAVIVCCLMRITCLMWLLWLVITQPEKPATAHQDLVDIHIPKFG